MRKIFVAVLSILVGAVAIADTVVGDGFLLYDPTNGTIAYQMNTSTRKLEGQNGWGFVISGSDVTGLGANPTATVGLTAVNGSATTFMRSDAAPAHGDTSSQASVDQSGGVVIQDVTLDGAGHVTALGTATVLTAAVNSITPAGGTLTVNGMLRTGGEAGIVSGADEYYFDGDSSYIGIIGGLLGYYNSSDTLQGMQGSKFVAPLVESTSGDVTIDPNASGAGVVQLGQAGDGDTIELNGDLVKTLSAATGNEYALNLEYTTNKATSGDDIGIRINQTDTASPGVSYLLWAGRGGNLRFYVSNDGTLYASGGMISTFLTSTGNDITLQLNLRNYTVADNAIEAVTGTVTNSSGQFNGLVVKPTYNQTGTAAGTDLLIQRTETAVGSGAQKLIDAQVGTTSKFSVDNAGFVSSNSNEFLATDIIRHTVTAGEETAGAFTESWSKATAAKVVSYSGSWLIGARSYAASFGSTAAAELAVDLNGTTLTVADNTSTIAENDVITICITYEK